MTPCPRFVSLGRLSRTWCRLDPSEKNASAAAAPATVNGARITAADSEPGQWMSHGRTYDEQRFSPLAGIKKENVKDLGLAWFADLDTHRGQEATLTFIRREERRGSGRVRAGDGGPTQPTDK